MSGNQTIEELLLNKMDDVGKDITLIKTSMSSLNTKVDFALKEITEHRSNINTLMGENNKMKGALGLAAAMGLTGFIAFVKSIIH